LSDKLSNMIYFGGEPASLYGRPRDAAASTQP
jgi:hypothetical protein